jgi:amidophosphoribosyltransferase
MTYGDLFLNMNLVTCGSSNVDSLKEISCKIAELVRPSDLDWNGELDVIYQDVEGLNAAMPAYTGDWYFTGNYPTPGGNAVVNRAYLNWYQGDDATRAY